LTRIATLGAIGSSEKTRPRMTNSGLPGGCGSPKVYAAAMYSLASHIAVEGDRVSRYNAKAARPPASASRYGGADEPSVPRRPLRIAHGIAPQYPTVSRIADHVMPPRMRSR